MPAVLADNCGPVALRKPPLLVRLLPPSPGHQGRPAPVPQDAPLSTFLFLSLVRLTGSEVAALMHKSDALLASLLAADLPPGSDSHPPLFVTVPQHLHQSPLPPLRTHSLSLTFLFRPRALLSTFLKRQHCNQLWILLPLFAPSECLIPSLILVSAQTPCLQNPPSRPPCSGEGLAGAGGPSARSLFPCGWSASLLAPVPSESHRDANQKQANKKPQTPFSVKMNNFKGSPYI